MKDLLRLLKIVDMIVHFSSSTWLKPLSCCDLTNADIISTLCYLNEVVSMDGKAEGDANCGTLSVSP